MGVLGLDVGDAIQDKGPLAPSSPGNAPVADKKPPPKEEPKPTDPNLDMTELVRRSGQGAVEAARANGRFNAQLMEMTPPQLQMPEKPKPENESYANAWGAAAMAFAALMGRKTGTPMTTALSAAAGALNGLQEGKIERAREQFERWRVENDNALKMGEYQLKTYHEVIGKLMTGREINNEAGKALDNETKAKLSALAVSFEDPLMAQAAATGDPEKVKEAFYEKHRMQKDLRESSMKLGKGGEAIQAWHMKKAAFVEQNGRQPSAMEDLNLYTEAAHEFGVPVGGKGGQGLTTPEQISHMAKLMATYQIAPPGAYTMRLPGWSEALDEATKSGAYRPADFPVIQKDIQDLETGKSAQGLRSFAAAAQHLQFFQELANRLPNNADVQTANAVTAALAKQFGMANVTSFEAARSLVGGEVAKAIVGGTSALRDREEVRTAFSSAMSKDQLTGAIQTAQRLISGQIDAMEDEHQTLKRDLPEKHAQYFDKPWRNYFQPDKAKANALTSTAQAPASGEGSSEKTPRPVSSMADALNFPNGTWLVNPAGDAVQMTDELRAAIQSQAGR